MSDTSEIPGWRALLQAAVLAPSSHNTQPWRFRVSAQRVCLFADRTRALPCNDPDDRELTISCGCALMNLRVAAAANDLIAGVAALPDSKDSDLLAEVALGESNGQSLGIAELAPEIPRRRTYRKRFDNRAVSPDVTRELSIAADAEGAALHFITSAGDTDKVAQLVAEGDTAQWADPGWRRELARWMHPRRKGDGLTVPGLIAPIAQLVVRTFDMGNGVAAGDRQLAAASPALAVLATPGDDVSDWLNAGQALERCLLRASQFGLQASYLNQPIQVAYLRPGLQELIPDRGFPQVLIRLGYPTGAIGHSPRRELEEVTEIDD